MKRRERNPIIDAWLFLSENNHMELTGFPDRQHNDIIR